jgi:hypothetical protein
MRGSEGHRYKQKREGRSLNSICENCACAYFPVKAKDMAKRRFAYPGLHLASRRERADTWRATRLKIFADFQFVFKSGTRMQMTFGLLGIENALYTLLVIS